MSPEQETFLFELFKAHAEALVRYAASFLNDTDRAEEVVQEAFRVAVIHIDELMDHEAPEYWLKRTVKIKHSRTRKHDSGIYSGSFPWRTMTLLPTPLRILQRRL